MHAWIQNTKWIRCFATILWAWFALTSIEKSVLETDFFSFISLTFSGAVRVFFVVKYYNMETNKFPYNFHLSLSLCQLHTCKSVCDCCGRIIFPAYIKRAHLTTSGILWIWTNIPIFPQFDVMTWMTVHLPASFPSHLLFLVCVCANGRVIELFFPKAGMAWLWIFTNFRTKQLVHMHTKNIYLNYHITCMIATKHNHSNLKHEKEFIDFYFQQPLQKKNPSRADMHHSSTVNGYLACVGVCSALYLR